MHSARLLPWVSPLDAARLLTPGKQCFVLLYSAMENAHSGRYSYLALDALQHAHPKGFSELEALITPASDSPVDYWFGYLGYGMRHHLETLPIDPPSTISLPDAHFTRFATVLQFDHHTQQLTLHGIDSGYKSRLKSYADAPPDNITDMPAAQPWQITSLASNMSRDEYMQHVQHILSHIHMGDIYQINLTRKFFGTLDIAPSPLALFAALMGASPSPYAALIQHDEVAILSSSPESFLSIDTGGHVITRPIKGSAPRGNNQEEDEQLRQQLHADSKERAENLMIVDLMRNDLSRSCVPGSVKLDALYEVLTYRTVQHLISSISAQKRDNVSSASLIAGCFPPGSMTGTPKIRAMQLASEYEKAERGIYSGALGWLSGNGSGELSVVIRTILLQKERFEFQVGGGIVADSLPEREWQETLLKARGICAALGCDMKALEAL